MREDADREEILAWLKRAAFHYLTRYSSSTDNLRRVLLRKARRRLDAFNEEAVLPLIDDAIAACRAGGLVDDLAYSETKVVASSRKGMSRRRIGILLKGKGIGNDTISTVLEEFDDRRAALRYARKRRLGPWGGEGADRSKDVGSLTRAGFSSSIAFEILNMSLSDAEDFLFAV